VSFGTQRRGSKEVKNAIWIIDGVKIGVISLGDLAWEIEQFIQDLIDAGCIIIICACRAKQNGSDSATFRVVKSLAEECGYDLRLINKTATAGTSEEQDASNWATAREIIQEVREAIDNAKLVSV
jgi:hypothetical protein